MSIATSTQSLIDRIIASPAGRRAVEEEKAEKAEEGRAKKLRLAELRAELSALAEKFSPRVTKAESAVKSAELVLLKSAENLRSVHAERRNAITSREREAASIEATLKREHRPALLDAFLAELDRELSNLSKREASARYEARYNLKTDHTEQVCIASEQASMKARAAAVVQARREAEVVALESLDDAELTRRLDAIRAALPTIVMEAVK